MRDYPLPARLYIEAVLLAAAVAVALSAFSVTAWGPTALLLALMVVLERTRFDLVAQGDVAASVGTVMTLPVATAAYIIDGPAAATLVGASALAVAGRTGWVKRVFNAAQFALAAGVAGLVYVWLGGPTQALTNADFPGVLLPILAANLAYCLVNAVLLTGVLWFAQGAPPLVVLRGTILQSAPSYLGYGLFGLMIAVLWVGVGIGPLSAVLVMLPLFVARWAIAQYALERSAYEATIRTLVRAVETKDHYTRGHSERVSHASVMIAKVARHGRRPTARAALRGHPARRRQARGAHQDPAEDRAAHRRRVPRRSSCTRCAAARWSRTSSSSARPSRGSCTTTSASTAAATRWASRARRSPSSPG